MTISGDAVLAGGVAILALFTLPLIVRPFLDLSSGEASGLRSIAAAAAVLGCLGMFGLVWAPRIEGLGWIVVRFALILLKLALVLIVIFTWQAFRPKQPAGRLISAALIPLLAISLALDLEGLGTAAHVDSSSFAFRFGQAVTSLPFFWLGYEAWSHWRRGRSAPWEIAARAGASSRLGAWALAATAFALQGVLALACSLLRDDDFSSALQMLRGLLYVAAAGCIWVAFYQPRVAGQARRAGPPPRTGVLRDAASAGSPDAASLPLAGRLRDERARPTRKA